MSLIRRSPAAVLLVSAAFAPLTQAQAAAPACAGGEAQALEVGSLIAVAPGGDRRFAVTLSAGDSVAIDLDYLSPPVVASDDESDAAPAARALTLCNAQGELLSPLPGEVFDKGGSLTKTAEGERLRFVAQSSGRYVIAAAAADSARELLVRKRPGGTTRAPIVSATLGEGQTGITSSSAPMVFSFAGPAGQWVELKSTSEKDTLLRLAGPDREGGYAVLAENDDSEGLNPVIRRKLGVAGTYYVQVDSLSDEPGEFALALNKIDAPKPPPPPTALRLDAPVSGRLADGDDVKLYALPVTAGRSYRLELTAAYDAVVAIGLANPIEPESGDAKDAGFAEVKSQDSGTTGTERLNFTARTSGQLLVRVKSFGIGETDGAFTLKAVDLGG